MHEFNLTCSTSYESRPVSANGGHSHNAPTSSLLFKAAPSPFPFPFPNQPPLDTAASLARSLARWPQSGNKKVLIAYPCGGPRSPESKGKAGVEGAGFLL